MFAGVGNSFTSKNLSATAKIADKQEVNVLKIAQLSDVHFDTKTKSTTKRLYGESAKLLEDAISQINQLDNLDLVVFSGDVVNRPDENDFIKFIQTANKLRYPWLSAPGNHDIGAGGGLSKSKYALLLTSHNRTFNSTKPYYSYVPKKGYVVIFLDGTNDVDITANGKFKEEQLKWLDNELRKYKSSKAIIVQHFPVIEPFKSLTHKVLNADEYLKVIDKHKNVVAVLSGHYHATRIQTRNNVVHVSSPALIEYPNAFRIITFKDYPQNIEINFKFMETGLKDLQSLSKSKSKSFLLSSGQANDQDATIILSKDKVVVDDTSDDKEITKKILSEDTEKEEIKETLPDKKPKSKKQSIIPGFSLWK